MPSWWGKSSSKEAKTSKKKRKDNSIFDALNLRKLKETLNTSSRGFEAAGGCNSSSTNNNNNNNNNNIEESASENGSPSPSTSTSVTRCHSFVERSNGHPLPLPCMPPASAVGRSESGITLSQQPPGNRSGRMSPFLPLPSPEQVFNRHENADGSASGSVSSVSSMSSDDPADREHSVASGSSITHAGLSPKQSRKSPRQEILRPSVTFPSKQKLPISAKRGFLNRREAPKYLQIPVNGAVGSAPDSSMSSPSRSPLRVYVSEHSPNGVFYGAKINPEAAVFGSGNCSSPGSGHNSGQNSMGGDMAALPFWQQSRGSSERSPIPSPRMRSPGPSSRAQSCAVSPLHPRFAGLGPESPTGRLEEGKHGCHPLPLPPHSPCNSSPYTPSVSASATSSAGPWSPGGKDNQTSPPGSRWKKGKLLGRGTFGHVYVGFNSESGEMCAMKEVTLFSDDPKSRESVKQLGQEIAMLSHLWHPNIVQYYGSETVDEMLYIYLEYVSGGSIHKLLQEYGQFRESVIRSYTQQILSGLAYLHNRNTVHRDIKGANILVDPNGQVKLADFGMAKHITAHSCPLSFKGSPYWMAPEVIKNVNGYDLAVDIWSLGCTVLEMATARPPWSQYEGVAAMFKIGNSKELPAIPEHFSEEGKSFVKLCLQRNPANRPTAAQLLEHPFVKNAVPFVKLEPSTENIEVLSSSANGTKPLNVTQSPLHTRNLSAVEMDYSIPHSRGRSRYQPSSDHSYVQRNISLPVSPSASPLIQPRSPHHRYGGMSPSPISTPVVSSGSSTPLTGGYGAIPFQANGALKHSVFLHEGFGNMTRVTNVQYIENSGLNGVYLDPRPDAYGAMQAHCTPEGSPQLQHHRVAEGDILGKAYGRVVRNENGDSPMQYNGQGAFAEHVSQQLLRTPSKLLGADFRPVSPILSRASGAEYY